MYGIVTPLLIYRQALPNNLSQVNLLSDLAVTIDTSNIIVTILIDKLTVHYV